MPFCKLVTLVVGEFIALKTTTGEPPGWVTTDQVPMPITGAVAAIFTLLLHALFWSAPAKAFDGSAPIGGFVNKDTLTNLSAIDFELKVNGNSRQMGNTKDLLFSFDKIIAYVSQFVTLKVGDLIYTGTPEGVGAVNIGDKLQGYMQGDLFFEFEVK